MNPDDKEQLLDTSFRFVSWLRNHFPEAKDRILRTRFPSTAVSESSFARHPLCSGATSATGTMTS